jgi:hypothetical protein
MIVHPGKLWAVITISAVVGLAASGNAVAQWRNGNVGNGSNRGGLQDWDFELNRPISRNIQPQGSSVEAQILRGLIEGLSQIPQDRPLPQHQDRARDRQARMGSSRQIINPSRATIIPSVPLHSAAPSAAPRLRKNPVPSPVTPNVLAPAVVPGPASLPKNIIRQRVSLSLNHLPFALSAFQPIPADDYEAVQQAMSELQESRLNEVDATLKQLGVESDSRVRARMEDVKRLLDEQSPISDEVLTNLEEAIAAASMARGIPLSSADVSRISDALSGLQVAGKVSAMFANNYPAGGYAPSISPHSVDLATVPGLPADHIYCLPGGGMVMGADQNGDLTYDHANTSDVLGVDVGEGKPVGDSIDGSIAGARSGVIIINPDETESSLQFLFQGELHSLQAGTQKSFPAGHNKVIEFDRGDSGPAARYTLTEGTYVFTAESGRWDLGKRTFKVILSNRRNQITFNYAVNDRVESLAAGGEAEHTSPYPLTFRFNRGQEGVDVTRTFIKPDLLLQPAVSPQDQLLDLFEENGSQYLQSFLQPKSVLDGIDFQALGFNTAESNVQNTQSFDLNRFKQALQRRN